MDQITLTETALAGVYDIVSVAGEEAVNALFDFRVAFVMPQGDHASHAGRDTLERVLLGTRVGLSLGEGASAQVRSGIVSEARSLGLEHTDDGPMLHLVVRVVPTAWLLTQRRKSRIFQKMYPQEIVSRVLLEGGVRHRWNLTNKYPRRIYCTQYDETDWAFVTRLLAEEGVMFYFAQQDEFASVAASAQATNVHEENRTTASAVFGAVGTVARKIGEAGDIGAAKMAGGGLQLVGDVIAVAEDDEEDPMHKEGGSGALGPAGAGDVMVIVDNAKHYDVAKADGEAGDRHLSIWLRREGEMTAGDNYVATAFSPHGAVRPDAVESRDYDFRRPLMLLKATTQERGAKLKVDREDRSLEDYEHHGEYETSDVNAENARNALDQHRARAAVFRAQGVCARVLPGHVFELHNGTDQPVQDGRFVPVRVVHHAINPRALGQSAKDPVEGLVRGAALAIHEAIRARDPANGHDAWTETELRELIRYTMGAFNQEQPAPYRCVFECVKSDVPARPPRPSRAPRNVTETATVVGPRGEDIYTDRYGRVKIQFHWDRGGRWDEGSSCWVRVAQTWAGAGYGFQFIPRVGMEVLVTFVRGDPDRPIVVGTLYNGTHETPEPLPLRKTRSAIRSQSSPDGGGFNELAFEDQAGVERVILRSQKDLEIIAHDHHARSVRSNETVSVGKSQTVSVGADQRTGVQDNQSSLVGGSQSASVRLDRTAYVARNEASYVDGGTYDHVRGSTTASVDGDTALGVNGSNVTVIRGDSRTLVGTDETKPRTHHLKVQGHALTVANRVGIYGEGTTPKTEHSVSIGCGDSLILLTHDTIYMGSKNISIVGSDELRMRGKDAVALLDKDGITGIADPITLTTHHGARMVLDGSKASLNGRRIDLTPETDGGAEETTERKPPEPNVKLRFTHDRLKDKKPMAGVRALLSGGVLKGKVTDGDGCIEFYAAPDVKTVTVRLYVHEKFPNLYSAEDEPMTFLVKLEDDIAEAGLVPGARFRLRNLGYEPGPRLDSKDIDPATEKAFVEFQYDTDGARTGQLDPVTIYDLKDVWGD